MRSNHLVLGATMTCALAIGPARAAAEGPAAPAAKPAPGLTLPAGKLNVTVNVEVNASTDAAGRPVSIAPDLAYGVTGDLTVTVVHSRFATTGFRGAAGGGLCVTGTDDGCPKLYDSAGVEVLYAVARGPLAVALDGGIHALSLDRDFYSAKVGARLRYSAGKLAVLSSPSVLIAATERPDDDATTPDNLDRLWVPVLVGYTVTPPLWIAGATGIKGPIDGFGDGWQLAVGAVATYKIDPTLAVGASLIFGQIAGGGDATGADHRWVQAWVSYTR